MLNNQELETLVIKHLFIYLFIYFIPYIGNA